VNREEARAAFPVLERAAYLNAGSFGPLARTTVAAMQERLQRDLEEGRSGGSFMDGATAVRDGIRERLAALIAVPQGNLALTTSTTRGCNIAIAGLRLQPGDEVVTTDSEHFGLVGPLHTSRATVRVARILDRSPEETYDVIAAEIGSRTRLVALSHVNWLTGHRLPLEQLRENFDVPLLVDGAQSVGAIPVDASAYDFYTVSGQKWLCGPDTTGALFVRDPEALEVATPSYFAQAEYEPEGRYTPREGAARFDSDWLPPASLAGLTAAVDAAPAWRYEAAEEMSARCRALLLEAVVAAKCSCRFCVSIRREIRDVFGARHRQEKPGGEPFAAKNPAARQGGFDHTAIVAVHQVMNELWRLRRSFGCVEHVAKRLGK